MCSLARAFTALAHAQNGAYIWHIPSVNAHTRLSVHAVSPDPSLLSHMHINGRICDIFFQPMLRLEEACMQACQSLHCSRTCTKWAYIWHIPPVNAQTRLSIHAVSPEPSLLSNMHINGRIYDIFFQPMRRLEVTCMLSCQCITALTHAQNGRTYGIFYQ